MNSNFIHLHNHSHYSLLDGAMSIDTILDRAIQDGQDAIALTDHGNMFGAIEFYTKAKAKGIKPIVGCEVYVAPQHRTDKNEVRSLGVNESAYHLVLLAQNETGYRNLMKLSSIGYLEGFYYKPRVDVESLEQHKEGLIALSACLAGEVPNKILRGNIAEAFDKAGQLSEIFGKDNFYLELQDHGIDVQKDVNKELLEFSKRSGIQLIATNDAHYASRNDSFAHEVLLCIQTGKQLSDEKRMRFDGNQFYLKSQQEMMQLFREVPEALQNTRTIADRINLELKLGEPALPDYNIPQGFTPASYLEHLAHEGKHKRYPKASREVEERLQYELSVINKMNFAGYFLIVQDFIQYAKRTGIPVGPGRGSAAGSVVSYCLGITDIDPLKYSLLFERFLNPDRIEMPDVDIDFCQDRREEVIHYVQEKYGKEKVSQVIAFGSIKSKNAIKDVGRVMGLPYNEMDQLAKMVPGDPIPVSLPKALETSKDLKAYSQRDNTAQSHIETSLKLEGLVRQASKHAAGIVIAKGNLTDYAPLFKDKDNNITTQYEKDTLAQVGLVKMDFLGLKNLTVIEHATRLIRQNHNINLDFDGPELKEMDDKKTYKMLAKGKTTGVFQLESGGMQALLAKAKPKVFEDIVAILALFRPGPLNSGMVDTYVDRKAGREPIRYDHPDLESVLKDTYGVIVYQEQVMLISQIIGGFTMAEADFLRKVMGKKKVKEIPAQREKFLAGAKKKNYDLKLAGHIFDQCATFAEYGFNKSHSVAYAVITYRTAYLKAHFPKEYMAALISADMDNTDKVVKYIHETRSMKIAVLQPDINLSEKSFSVSKEGINFSLTAVKNVGSGLVEGIVAEREAEGPFNSIIDFIKRLPINLLNSRSFESLIQAGAFDSMGYPRRALYENAEMIMKIGQESQKDKAIGQFSLFDQDGNQDMQTQDLENQLRAIPEWPIKEKLKREKEMLGFFLSAHLLDSYKKEVARINAFPVSQIPELSDRSTVLCVGVISDLAIRTAKKTNKQYATFTLDSWDGRIEIMVFNTYLEGGKTRQGKEIKPIKDRLIEDSVVAIRGEISIEEESDHIKLFMREIFSLEEAKIMAISAVHLHLPESNFDNNQMIRLQTILSANKGDKPIYFHIPNGTNNKEKRIVQASDSFWIAPSVDLMQELTNILPQDKIIFSY